MITTPLLFFGFLGLLLMIFGGIMGVTAFVGWVSNDDDGTLKWLITSLGAAVTISILIMQRIV